MQIRHPEHFAVSSDMCKKPAMLDDSSRTWQGKQCPMRHELNLCLRAALQEALRHIHPPADASAAAADAAEDSRLTAGARLSAQQKCFIV